jgi:hypothetical protein
MLELLDRSESMVKKIKEIMRGVRRMDDLVGSELARLTPLLRLTMEVPHLLDRVFAYRAAREAVIKFGGKLFREAYHVHLEVLGEALNTASADIRAAVLLEVRAFHKFVEDLDVLKKALPEVRTLPPSPFSHVNAAILRRCQEAICEDQAPAAAVTKAAWHQILQAFGPENEAEWDSIAEVARKAAIRTSAGGKTAAKKSVDGHLNRIQGALFEQYARKSPHLVEEFDLQFRSAAVKASRLGEAWEPVHIHGEMHLAAVSPEELKNYALTGRLPQKEWKQFADGGVVAARIPDRPNAGLGEVDFTALFQFKAEAGSSKLVTQNVQDLFRVYGGAGDKTVLVKFEVQQIIGTRRQVVCALRPPNLAADPVTYFAIATSNTEIPDTVVLALMGVNLRRINLPPSRNDLRDLATKLFLAAVEKLPP